MARTKGSLNRKTRAALSAVKTGELLGKGTTPVEYLLKVMRDPKKDESLRIEAAKSVAPYLHARLSHVETVELSPDDQKTDAELYAQLEALMQANPTLLSRLVALQPNVEPEHSAPEDQQVH